MGFFLCFFCVFSVEHRTIQFARTYCIISQVREILKFSEDGDIVTPYICPSLIEEHLMPGAVLPSLLKLKSNYTSR